MELMELVRLLALAKFGDLESFGDGVRGRKATVGQMSPGGGMRMLEIWCNDGETGSGAKCLVFVVYHRDEVLAEFELVDLADC